VGHAMFLLAEPRTITDLDTAAMANAAELTTQHATLKERVTNHIKFFWAVFAFFAAWLAAISAALFTMNGTLNSIKANQQELHSSITTIEASTNPRKALEDIAKAPPLVFAKLLPAVRKLSQQPPSEIRPGEPQLQQIAYKLRTGYKSEADYWPTVFQFINFASSSVASEVPPSSPTPNLVISQSYGIAPGTISHQLVLLDGGYIHSGRFEHCRIQFSSNPIRMENITFVDCIFEFPPEQQTPDRFLQQASEQILRSDFRSVYITSLG